MKKTICTILALAMLFTTACIAETGTDDPGTVLFDANLTNMIDNTVRQWMSGNDTRALLTILLAIDMTVSMGLDEMPIDATKTSFVGSDGDIIGVLLRCDDGEHDYAIVYQPATGTAAYSQMPTLSDTLARIALESECLDGVYENDHGTLAAVAGELTNAMEAAE